jgi:hypothetical protein
MQRGIELRSKPKYVLKVISLTVFKFSRLFFKTNVILIFPASTLIAPSEKTTDVFCELKFMSEKGIPREHLKSEAL